MGKEEKGDDGYGIRDMASYGAVEEDGWKRKELMAPPTYSWMAISNTIPNTCSGAGLDQPPSQLSTHTLRQRPMIN